jgi:hypothetical protein
MTIYIYVEGETEVQALPQVLAGLYATRQIKRPISLGGSLFKSIGRTAAEILVRNPAAHAFACPDLAPNDSYLGTPWEYHSYEQLQAVLTREVRNALDALVSPRAAADMIRRLHAHPFRHDFEVVLLALPERLGPYLRTQTDLTKRYGKNPEDHNFDDYPSRVVNRLFNEFAHTRYRKADDARRVLGGATKEDLDLICARCPRFAEFVGALRQLVIPRGA